MKHITIVIPTRGRCKRLIKTLDNIPREDYIDIRIVCDGDRETYDYLYRRRETDSAISKIIFLPGHHGSVHCRNLLIRDVKDGLLYGTDDILFGENVIQHALEFFNQEFPDDDGVVGFKQDLSWYSKSATGLVGQKFLQRYPNKCLFYPKYFHFACQEIERLTDAIESQKRVFAMRDDLKLKHAHPSVDRKYCDATHRDARLHATEDHSLSSQRRAKKLIWGLSDEK